MERVIALQSLSRAHDLDRQTCVQLLKGIQARQDKNKVKQAVLDFWQNDLQKHIASEEQVLLPFLARHHFDNQYLALLQREHDTLRVLAQRLSLHDDGYYLYEVFVNLVQQHISFKDEVLLDKVEKDIPAPELAQLRM